MLAGYVTGFEKYLWGDSEKSPVLAVSPKNKGNSHRKGAPQFTMPVKSFYKCLKNKAVFSSPSTKDSSGLKLLNLPKNELVANVIKEGDLD